MSSTMLLIAELMAFVVRVSFPAGLVMMGIHVKRKAGILCVGVAGFGASCARSLRARQKEIAFMNVSFKRD